MENSDLPSSNAHSSLRSLTRLVVGGLLLGTEGLATRLARWEKELDQQQTGYATVQPAAPEPAAAQPALLEASVPEPVVLEPVVPEPVEQAPAVLELPSGELLTASPEGEPGEGLAGGTQLVLAADETARRNLHMVVGMVFGLQGAVERSLNLTYRATRTAGNLVDLVTGPLYRSRALTPLRDRIETLAERGQEQVDRWVENGRIEEQRSRDLAQRTFTGQVDEAINYLTSDEEVQELVQSQGVGLVGEILEETRERSLSADSLLEEIVRSMFRRPPRTELPPPAPEVQVQAVSFRQLRGRIINK
jgi:hypothetical protein